MTFDEIKKLQKRCNHFCPPMSLGRGRGNATGRQNFCGAAFGVGAIKPEGMGVAAHNHDLMRAPDDSRIDQLLWLESLARSFNRYIDGNRITGDNNAIKCLRWWRRQLFFDPSQLT